MFDVLALVEPSGLSTFEVQVEVAAPGDLEDLKALCGAADVRNEDWTSNVRWLCTA